MVPVGSSVVLEPALAVHSYHVIAYPDIDLLIRWCRKIKYIQEIWWLVCAISSFRPEITPREKTKRRKDATRKDAMRKDEITPRKKTKSATRKDDKLTVLNVVFSHIVFSSFRVGISTFRVAGFVI